MSFSTLKKGLKQETLFMVVKLQMFEESLGDFIRANQFPKNELRSWYSLLSDFKSHLDDLERIYGF